MIILVLVKVDPTIFALLDTSLDLLITDSKFFNIILLSHFFE